MSDPEPARPPAGDRRAAEARRLQARTWVTVAVIWIVMAAIVVFDSGASPAVRTLFVVTGLCQAVAAIVWLRAGRRNG
jgi:hypothetical protein